MSNAVQLVLLNTITGISTDIRRTNLCTLTEINKYADNHNETIHFKVFQPYLDYKGKDYKPPYEYKITIDCFNSTDYFYMEDWRNAQLLFWPYKFCLEDYKNNGG